MKLLVQISVVPRKPKLNGLAIEFLHAIRGPGSGRDKILSATIYLADMADFKEMNEVWDNWIPEGEAPARACVQAQMASPELKVEISVVAAA